MLYNCCKQTAPGNLLAMFCVFFQTTRYSSHQSMNSNESLSLPHQKQSTQQNCLHHEYYCNPSEDPDYVSKTSVPSIHAASNSLTQQFNNSWNRLEMDCIIAVLVLGCSGLRYIALFSSVLATLLVLKSNLSLNQIKHVLHAKKISFL